MRVTKYNFLFVAGLVLTLGMSAAFANGYNAKAPKDMGTLSVQTNPESLSVKVDGRYVGMSRTGNKGAEFYLAPGFYTVEVTGPNGLFYSKNNVEILRGKKNCICLTILNKPSCPYRFNLERSPDIITQGETVTFRMKDSGTGEMPTSYKWIVTPRSAADSMTGQGTSSITVSSKDLAGQVIRAELDANNDNYVNDNRCRAAISVPVTKIPACPYRFTVDASAYSIVEGETVTFTANNSGNAPTPTRYKWIVTPGAVANSMTGQGTSSITVSSKDFVGREIRAELDANDDNYPSDN